MICPQLGNATNFYIIVLVNPFLAVFPSKDRGSILLTSRFLEFIVSLLQGMEDLISQERDAC